MKRSWWKERKALLVIDLLNQQSALSCDQRDGHDSIIGSLSRGYEEWWEQDERLVSDSFENEGVEPSIWGGMAYHVERT